MVLSLTCLLPLFLYSSTYCKLSLVFESVHVYIQVPDILQFGMLYSTQHYLKIEFASSFNLILIEMVCHTTTAPFKMNQSLIDLTHTICRIHINRNSQVIQSYTFLKLYIHIHLFCYIFIYIYLVLYSYFSGYILIKYLRLGNSYTFLWLYIHIFQGI